MELELLSGLVDVDGDVVTIVHLLLDVTIYLFGNIGFIGNLDIKSTNPLGGTIVVFTQFIQFLGVQTFNRHFVVDLVHKCVVHDVHDALFFGDLSKLIPTGGIGVFLSGDCEK